MINPQLPAGQFLLPLPSNTVYLQESVEHCTYPQERPILEIIFRGCKEISVTILR